MNIEEKINASLESVKKMQPAELPPGFSERVVNRLHSPPDNVRSLYSFSPLLRVAAIFVLVLINIVTLKLALAPQPVQNPAQYGTIKDFVNQYQINDANEEVVTTNIPAHE